MAVGGALLQPSHGCCVQLLLLLGLGTLSRSTAMLCPHPTKMLAMLLGSPKLPVYLFFFLKTDQILSLPLVSTFCCRHTRHGAPSRLMQRSREQTSKN